MASDSQQPAFPLLTTIAALTLPALALYGVAAWAVPVFFGRPDGAFAGVSLMALVAWFSLLLSVLPVALLGRLGVMATVYAYFAGGAMRFVICLAAGAVLVKVEGLPAGPVMVTLAWMYIPLLFIEAGLVGRYLWQKDALKKKPTGPGTELPGTPGTPGIPGTPGKEALA